MCMSTPLSFGRPSQVVVGEDDEVNRRGITSLLAECEGVELVAGVSHQEAMHWCWEEVDVALVDAADERAEGDQFPGVAVVQQVRRQRAPHQTMVVVVTGHFFDDALRRRLREARADFLYHRTELADRRVLYDAMLNPDNHRRVPGPQDTEAERRHGLSNATRVNRAVAFALEHRLEERLAHRTGSRRAWLHLRRQFNDKARLTPMTSAGNLPDRQQDMPSLPQITRFLAWATRVKAHTTAPGRWMADGERSAG